MSACLKSRGIVLAIIGVGLVVRLAVLLLYLSTHDWYGETWEPEIVAKNLLEGQGFTVFAYGDIPYRSLVPPVFPVLCYVFHLVGGPSLGLYYVFQLSIAAGIIWLTYVIAERWFGFLPAAIAALLVALEPGLVFYHSYKVESIALGTFLFLLGTYTFVLMTLSPNVRLAACTGLIMGLGVMTRPDMLGIFVLLPLWAIFERKRFLLILKLTLVVIVVAAMVWAPWAIRNYRIHSHFVFLTTYSGESLWRGNNPNSTGTTITFNRQSQFDAAPTEFREKIATANEIQKDALFKEEAQRFIANDPIGFLWRVCEKIYYFWWFTPTYATQYYEWVPSPLVGMYQILYGMLLAFAILGTGRAVKRAKPDVCRFTWYLLAAPFSVAAIHGISYVEGRHRVLVMPFVLILAAYGIAFFLKVFTGIRADRSHADKKMAAT